MSCCAVTPVSASSTGFENSPWKASASASAKIPKFCCTEITASNYATTTASTQCTDNVAEGYYSTVSHDVRLNVTVCIHLLVLCGCCTIVCGLICYYSFKSGPNSKKVNFELIGLYLHRFINLSVSLQLGSRRYPYFKNSSGKMRVNFDCNFLQNRHIFLS